MEKYTEYAQELADEICDVISSTPKSLKQLCEENPHWPERTVIYKWILRYPDFGNNYMRAKAVQCNWLAEDALIISKDGSKDTYIDEKGKEKCDHEWVQRSRLIVDTIKWYTAKLAPRLYGDKLQLTSDADPQEELIKKAKEEVEKIKKDDHGRSSEPES